LPAGVATLRRAPGAGVILLQQVIAVQTQHQLSEGSRVLGVPQVEGAKVESNRKATGQFTLLSAACPSARGAPTPRRLPAAAQP
jgi:hypothetical protein